MSCFFRRYGGSVLLAVLVGLLFWARPAYAEPELKKLITVAGDENFPPYEFLDERNGLKIYRGFNIDLIRAVMAKTDLDVQFVPMPWEEALRALQDGRVDAVGGMKYDAERSQRYDFSEEYLINSLAIFVSRSNSIIVDLEDLAQKRVAVQKDDIAYQKLKSRVLEMTATVSQEEAMKLLVDGKVDAVVGNRMAGQYLLQRLGAMDSVKTVGGVINPERYGLAMRRGNSEFLAKFNDGLRKIKADGTYNNIYVKWFGEPVDYPAYYYKKYLKYLAGGLAVMAMLIVIFLRLNYVLKREVSKRTQEISQVNAELVCKNVYIKNVNRYQSSVLNSGYGGILTSDANGIVRFANRYACEYLGISSEPASLSLRELPNCGWIMDALDNGTAAGEAMLEQKWLEFAILRLEADNQTEEIIIHFRDITEDKYLRAEVIKSQKMEALGQLVASIAHEIRTPLTSIKAFTELLPHKYDNPDFREKISRFVPQEIERLNRVVNDLLTYSNPPAVQKEKIMLKTLVNDVLVYFADAFSRQGIRCSLELDECLSVAVDKNQIKQVLINVLLNAVQALRDQPDPLLAITAESGGDGQLTLAVNDNGPGIALPDQTKVFEPFFTTKADGTGLGLFVSYQLARRNDVEIRLSSSPGLGTEVRLIFKREQEGAA
ncbi:MAG: transporter substrate-binding domain-containing protein [Veillonellaceae bacterium]|nr:transporter substrate-binding domain-containing protein [Veillonellaceae bacterium]